MRRSPRVAAAAVGLTALVVGAAAPAGAQEPLGFTVDKTQGLSGEVVAGQVAVADVAAGCTTDLGAFQARFQELLNGPFAGGTPQGELFDRFFPTGDFIFENHDQAAYTLLGLVSLGVGFDVNGAAGRALPQTFVMTFADIATQEPVGERGSFDPATGAGTVAVPDVEPGLWAVAAACVGPTLDLDLLEAGIREGGAFLQELGAPFDLNSLEFFEWVEERYGEGTDIFEFIEAIGPDLLVPVMVPDALGVQLFTVLADPADLIAEIEGLVSSGELSGGYAQGLVAPLENAARSLAGGDVESACDQLDGVSDRNIPANILDPQSAGELIGKVQVLEAHLGCT
ncbi:MAG TPA: hypothetical protein VFZ68_06160 [Acidimicrobiales bacterium]